MAVKCGVSSTTFEMRKITKRYPGVDALVNVDFSAKVGEVHALVGENGAGKSTLIKVLGGAEKRDSGEVIVGGVKTNFTEPQQAIDSGIAIIYQEFNLVPNMTVAENVFLGREPLGSLPGFINYRKMYSDVGRIFEELGVKLDLNAPVSRLSVAQQQMVEIAKAVSQNAKIIAMDEPSATLTGHEIKNLFELIQRLKSEGVCVIYISHRLEEIFEIADIVTILRDGMLVDCQPVARLDKDAVIKMMVGRELGEVFPKVVTNKGQTALEVRGISREGVIENISFSVKKGEVLGIAGLVGSGRTEVARAIFGADKIDKGEIFIDGSLADIKSPLDAIMNGIGLVTEDRKGQGLFLGMTISENITMANLREISKWGFIKCNDEKRNTYEYVKDLHIKTPSVSQSVQNLSGGNQQKVVLAKWLFTKCRVLIFDEPTRGIDIGAKTEIYHLINRLADEGVAIIMISSELPEIIGMSDRIIVMHEGKVAGELSSSEASQEKIMLLATGN